MTAVNAILGLGTDIVEVDRLRQSLERTGEAFLEKVYTDAERAAMPANGQRRLEYLAGRWAAKEAFAKALGTGITSECRLAEVSVCNDPESGRPRMTLTGAAAATAARLGVRAIHLSISHERHYAVATVLITA